MAFKKPRKSTNNPVKTRKDKNIATSKLDKDEQKNYFPGALTSVSQTDDDKILARRIEKRFTSGVEHKHSLGLYEEWAEYDRFWNADQWPEVTMATRDLPRPVTNHFASIIEQKVAGLTYESPDIYFEPIAMSSPLPKHEIIYADEVEDEDVIAEDDLQALASVMPPDSFRDGRLPQMRQMPQSLQMPPNMQSPASPPPIVTPDGIDNDRLQRSDQSIDAADLLSHIAKHQMGKMEFDDLLEIGTRTAALLGTAIWYMPWDNSITGGSTGQGTAYIGDIAGYEIDPTDFFPGDPTNRDIQSQPWVILAERRPLSEVKEFYREFSPDIVDFLEPEKRTSSMQTYDQERIELSETDYVDVIHCWWKEKDGYASELNYATACQGKLLRHEEELYKHGLYPFAAFQWYPMRKSFWGKPESKDLISNQKEENRLAGISLLSAYAAGMPNTRYKPDYVDELDIPIGPGGGVIPDNAPIGFWAVDYMQPPSPSSHIPQLRDSLITGLKDITGVHEAWSGKAPTGGQLNASAIIALQEAAGVRIRGIQRRLHKAIRDIGRIWLAHWKEFYKENRIFRIAGDDNQTGYVWFKGTDYESMQFDVRVQAGTASPYSKSILLANLDKMLETSIITPDEYLELLPPDTFPKAHQILERRKEDGYMGGMPGQEGQAEGLTQLAGQAAQQEIANLIQLLPEMVAQVVNEVLAGIMSQGQGLQAGQAASIGQAGPAQPVAGPMGGDIPL